MSSTPSPYSSEISMSFWRLTKNQIWAGLRWHSSPV
jgi:hypothetical protein